MYVFTSVLTCLRKLVWKGANKMKIIFDEISSCFIHTYIFKCLICIYSIDFYFHILENVPQPNILFNMRHSVILQLLTLIQLQYFLKRGPYFKILIKYSTKLPMGFYIFPPKKSLFHKQGQIYWKIRSKERVTKNLFKNFEIDFYKTSTE